MIIEKMWLYSLCADLSYCAGKTRGKNEWSLLFSARWAISSASAMLNDDYDEIIFGVNAMNMQLTFYGRIMHLMRIWAPFTLYRIAIASPQLSYQIEVLFTSHQSYPIQDAPRIGAKSTSLRRWYENHSGMVVAWCKWGYPIHFFLQLNFFSFRTIKNNEI